MIINMERTLAEKFSKELSIDITQIVREYYEILVLRGISKFPESESLIFKGGTALRLVYNSPRFSEDLDFSLTRDILKGKFKSIIKQIISPFPEMEITDLAKKRYTYLAEIKISQDYLPLPFRIKIEISKRLQENYNFELKMIKSPCSIYSVLLQVATIEQLYGDKLLCVKNRKEPKDFFDLWFLSELLGKKYEPKTKIDIKILKRDLRKFLPAEFYKVIEVL
ncbi:nucleotidyl transferase AbiEii/AbiGii toxin family protein [candidate division WOR-3 bacterium]|nr:nucleotidyl transferase AbiEii/AbiGii toxin family protein [candidate division WOR-3 bacterium]